MGFILCEARCVEAEPQKRRAVIGVESDETQDYASERRRPKDLGQEETEEVGYAENMASSTSSSWLMCRKKVVLLTQPTRASSATTKGEFSKANASGSSTVERNHGAKSVSRKVFGMEQFMRGMWERFTVKGASAKAVFADAEKENQEGMQGKWQFESPFMEVLDQIKKK